MLQVANQNMTPEQFVYWLQGFFELTEQKEISENQVKIIKEHLSYIFNRGHIPPQKVNDILPNTYRQELLSKPSSPIC